jgi:hypothetical protein
MRRLFIFRWDPCVVLVMYVFDLGDFPDIILSLNGSDSYSQSKRLERKSIVLGGRWSLMVE